MILRLFYRMTLDGCWHWLPCASVFKWRFAWERCCIDLHDAFQEQHVSVAWRSMLDW